MSIPHSITGALARGWPITNGEARVLLAELDDAAGMEVASVPGLGRLLDLAYLRDATARGCSMLHSEATAIAAEIQRLRDGAA